MKITLSYAFVCQLLCITVRGAALLNAGACWWLRDSFMHAGTAGSDIEIIGNWYSLQAQRHGGHYCLDLETPNRLKLSPCRATDLGQHWQYNASSGTLISNSGKVNHALAHSLRDVMAALAVPGAANPRWPELHKCRVNIM